MKLEIGSNDRFEVRMEAYSADVAEGFSVLYLSDLHFNRFSGAMISKITSRISDLDPDIILLGGDYIDFKRHLVYLNDFLKAISGRKNIFAIAGNHDYRFGVERIKEMMAANNIGWIENSSVVITLNNTTVQIDGASIPAKEPQADFSILCLHQPVDINRFKDNYNLAFAGHLHGCQFIFWQNEKGFYPGKLFYRWNMPGEKSGKCSYYISKGMGDTLPVRFNCAKEMIFVTVTGKNK